MTAITAVIHLGPIEKTGTTPGRIVGQQLTMDGLHGALYITAEVAKQWLPIIETIATEKSN